MKESMTTLPEMDNKDDEKTPICDSKEQGFSSTQLVSPIKTI